MCVCVCVCVCELYFHVSLVDIMIRGPLPIATFSHDMI